MEIPDLKNFELDHLSVSQLRTWLMCGVRWAFDNAQGEDRTNSPGWSARLRGSSLDAAANEHFNQKYQDGVGFSLAQFKERAVAEHEAGEDSHMFEMSESSSRDRTAKIAEEYRKTFGESFQPWAAATQDKFKYQDDELLVPVHGIIDLQTTNMMIVDNKVKGKKNVPSQATVDRDLQLTTYSMATGWPVVALAIISDEDRPKPHLLISERTPDQVKNIRFRYNQMVQSIRAGILHPAPEGAWYCNAKWCSHWMYCPFGGAEDVPIPGLEE